MCCIELKLKQFKSLNINHFVKSVHIWSYSGPYSVQLRQNTDQNNSEYGHFSRSQLQGLCFCRLKLLLMTTF